MATLDVEARKRIVKEKGVSALPNLDGGEKVNIAHDHIDATGDERGT